MWNQTPLVADVPPGGTRVSVGEPVCTVFTVGKTAAECLAQMPDAVESVKSRLFT
jgi:predicted ATP-grasp superfamily ATP-dependent carboligase